MVDFFRLYSHGRVDIGGTEVFGWFDLPHPRSEYVGSGGNPGGRAQLLTWAREAAQANGVPLGDFVNVVACMNVSTDLFGGGNGVVTPNGNMPLDMSPSLLGQEMLHTFELGPSGDDATPGGQYLDPWDVMSTASATMASNPSFFRIGPGLHAANMFGLGWLDPGRVWTRAGSFDRRSCCVHTTAATSPASSWHSSARTSSSSG